jgi:hypothetical protein
MRFPREVTLDDQGGVMRLGSTADVDRVCRALNVATAVLEEIGQLDKGVAGDRATQTLKDLGVWSERVERVPTADTTRIETLAVALFNAAKPTIAPIDPRLGWHELHDETKDRWRAYAIQVLDTEAVLG